MTEKIYFTGTIEAIFFSNPSNFYKVLLLEVDDTNSAYEDYEIVVTGTIGELIEGDSYTFYGKLTTHPKYGEQLQVETYEKAVPTSAAGLIKYFSSDKFPGIGKKTAERIVALFPDDTVDSILSKPEELDSILPLAKKNSFIKRLRDNHGVEKILSKLAEYGIPSKLQFQIHELYKDQTLDIIAKNPYQLVEDIKGIGFKTADQIAQELGIAADSSDRFRAGLMHVVKTQPLITGDTYIEARDLLQQTIQLLEEARQIEVSPETVAEEINRLLEDGKMQQEETKIFENSLYFAEQGISEYLKKLIGRSTQTFSDEKILKNIEQVESKLGIRYDKLQKEAIFQALNSQFFILTGGPGTGKTTIINGFIETYAQLHDIDLDPGHYHDDVFPILLAAPTGRASRRMNELTGLPAATLHRHLGLNTDEAMDMESNDLAGSLLIVDEFSMVDTWLANKLLQAIPPSMKVLFVGDADQLPSVGPGQVFADLLKFPEIPSVRLDKIFRQGAESTIIDLAHEIKEGHLPQDFTSRHPDRSYFEAGPGQVAPLVTQVATAWKKRGNNPFELQILAPMYKGVAGINTLNGLLQELFNPLDERQEFNYQDIHFREEDKVLHLVNDAENNVFNGDLGRIVELIPAKHTESKQDEIVMDFDGQEVSYPRAEWYKITLAYAMSIHKSQGSEFSTVVVPMVSSYSRMLERNLLYTAITRAKQSLILIGEQKAFAQAVQKESANRKTFLKERFTGKSEPGEKLKHTLDADKSETTGQVSLSRTEEISLFPEENVTSTSYATEPFLTADLVNSGDFDPLIGLTAADFAIFK